MASAQHNTQGKGAARAFTLVEVAMALTVLALFTSGVLVVIDRCIGSATNSGLRMRAFQIARENMEMLLTADSLEETVEYGESEKYPGHRMADDSRDFLRTDHVSDVDTRCLRGDV